MTDYYFWLSEEQHSGITFTNRTLTDIDTMLRPLYPRPLLDAGLAQMVEHLICNQRVRGSSPLTGTKFFNGLRENNKFNFHP